MNGAVARATLLSAALLAAAGCGGSSTHTEGHGDAGDGGAASSGGVGPGQAGTRAMATSGGTGGQGGTGAIPSSGGSTARGGTGAIPSSGGSTARGGTGAIPSSGGTAGQGAAGGVEEASGAGGLSELAAAGLSMNLSDPKPAEVPNLGSRSCPAGETGAATYTFGQPAPGRTIEDGTSSASVACIVTASGTVNASLAGYDEYTKQRIEFEVLSTVTDELGMSPAKITFYTPTTGALQVLDGFPDCTIGPVATLKDGAILADFRCPMLGADSDTSTGCLAVGTLAFEYCGTQ